MHTTHEMLVVPGDCTSVRNSEGDVIVLRDGRLLLGWTEFQRAEGEDWSPSRFSGKTSEDGGITWSSSFCFLEGEGKNGVMEVNFQRMPSGDIALFYLEKNSFEDYRLLMRRSGDEGKSWGEPKRLSDWTGYVGGTNARSMVTSGGRVVVPFAYSILPWGKAPGYSVSQAFYSDDDGETWHLSRPPLGVPGSERGCGEPATVELSDGRLLMMMRNTSGRIWQSISSDGGTRWEPPEPTELATSQSPISLRRFPDSTDILVIWNQASKREIEWGFVRNRLSCAISTDDGRSWRHYKNLESLDDVTHVEPPPVGEAPEQRAPIWDAPVVPAGSLNCSYPSCTFFQDTAVITYDVPATYCALKLRVLPIAWFYDDDAESFRSVGRGGPVEWMPRAHG